MQTRSTFSLLFYLDKARAKNGQATLKARITVNGKRSTFSLNRKVDISKWSIAKSRMTGSSSEARNVNRCIDNVQVKVQEAFDQLEREGVHISAQAIKSRYLGEDKQEYTLLELVDYHNDKAKETLSWGTRKNYYTTLKYLKLFLRDKLKVEDIYLSKLSYQFLIDFENFLRKHTPTDHQKKMGNNTVMKHIQRLRKLVTMAYKMEWLERDPFIKFKPTYIKNEREFLNETELQKLLELNFSIKRLEVVKDLFVFACYTGLSYIDVMNLTEDNLVTGIDGGVWIVTSRQKTNNSVKIPLLDLPQELISIYQKDIRIKDNHLFPNLSNQKLNAYLKEIADLCGIRKRLTFHVARHTFATTVTLGNGVPISTVSKLLGHSKIATTQIYARVLESKISEDMQALKDVLIQKKGNGSKHKQLSIEGIK
ncbi:integrase [Nonlabens sp. MIC269]|uniref:site-specific integrase n=1 Tax=Nonlabens sp. MIC269 TaxID=1476901 RepID=UPI00071FE62F|nr:site-specific integrase [Nonlabens sp. MIC269]ALM21984.1 integrase [Nonlabens sp. MIC269]